MKRTSPPVIQIRSEGRIGRYAEGLEEECVRWLEAASARLQLGSRHELSVLLCDGPIIHRLNLQWRAMDKPTDVLSFPLQTLRPGERAQPGALGDIVVALPVARRQAREAGLEFGGHLRHLLVHGLLHLLGYDHHDDAEAEEMEREEERLLKS